MRKQDDDEIRVLMSMGCLLFVVVLFIICLVKGGV